MSNSPFHEWVWSLLAPEMLFHTVGQGGSVAQVKANKWRALSLIFRFILHYPFRLPFSVTDQIFLQFLFLISPKPDLLYCRVVLYWCLWKSKVCWGVSPPAAARGWQLKGTSGTKRSRRSDVGTLTLGRDPLPPSPLFEKEREAGPLSKKALKHVLDLKTCEKSLYCPHPFLRFSVTWMCI